MPVSWDTARNLCSTSERDEPTQEKATSALSQQPSGPRSAADVLQDLRALSKRERTTIRLSFKLDAPCILMENRAIPIQGVINK
ncbi:hypothetical protein FACS1894167_02140 [Synergistales bacterium]|nr:hypothetical protein FACS1894167_02140 [Synergistales bacterium]